MKKNELKSDVGLLELVNERKLLSNYITVSETINRSIKDIFNNYLSIGKNLKYIDDNKMYEIEDFKNITDYAKTKFDLSATTVRNVIAINSKFINEDGKLDEKYEGFSFSQLVEMVSIDDDKIKSYVPSLTVKNIREFKRMDKLMNNLDLNLNSGFISELLKYVLEYDYKELLNLNLKVTHEIKYNDFYRDDLLSNIDLWFDFEEVKRKKYFRIKFDLVDSFISIGSYYSKNNWGYGEFESYDNLDELDVEEIKKTIIKFIKNSWITEENDEDDNEEVDTRVKYRNLSWGYFSNNVVGNLIKDYAKKKNYSWYYEELENVINIYSDQYEDESNELVAKILKDESDNFELVDLDNNSFVTSINKAREEYEKIVTESLNNYFEK